MSSAFAVKGISDCGMMDSNSMLMSNSAMNDMECEMPEEMSCNIVQCMSSCTASISPVLLPEEHFSFLAFGRLHFQNSLVHFYSIVHPINTPPPLV